MKFIGKQIGNHRLVAAINSGSYGSVYRATHTVLLGHTVAVKVLHSYLDSTKEREKFLQEARLLALLKHRHILPIHDAGFSDELPYIVVEYAPGGSLRDHLKRRAGHPLPNEEALRVLLQIGQALTHAHQQNIIHRDLKPENILFNEQGEALLSDFGIATVVETSMKQTGIIGTPTYMAPEQFQGIVSKEVDQYALGCIAYELYTGRKVFEAPDFMAMAFLHRTEVPTPPSRYNAQLPPRIEQAILRALAKNRTDRHPDILAFLDALRSTSSAEERSIPPTLPSEGISIESWLSEGEAHLRLNRPREALAIFEQILQFIPVHIPALIGKGKSFSALERYQEAEQVFNEIVRLEPGKLSHRKALEMVRAQIKKKNGESSSGETGRPTPYPALELYNQGNAFYEQKQYEQALRTFAEAVRLEPGNASFHSGRGRALYTLKRYEEALAAFKEAAGLAPKVPLYVKTQGEILYDLKRYQEALAAFEKAAQLEPGDPSYRKKIEEIRAQLKREEEARAQNKLKEDAASQHKQGSTFSSSKQYEKALTAFTEAARLQPDNAEYQSARGRTLHTLKRYEEALAAFLNAASLDPKKGYYYKMQGEALYELKRYQDALQTFEKAIQLEPAATSYSKKIKEIRAQLKREEEARAQNKAKEDAASQYKQGNTFFSSKQYEKALTAFTEAVRLQPSNAEYQSARGRTLHTLKRYEQALAAFKEASRLAPEIHDHIKWQGDALYELKRYQEALQAFEKVARLQPNTVYYHKMQAESLHKLKRYQEALAAFEKAAQLEPSNSSYRKKIEEIRAQLKREEETRVQNQSKEKATSLYKQGNTLSSSKQLDKALMAYWEAVRLQPNNPDYLKALAHTFDRLQRYEEALAAFRDLAYLQPKDSTHLQMQAEMLWKLKRHQEALAMYEQAISMEPRRVYRNRLEEMHAQIKQQETGLQKLLNLFR